MYKRNEETFRQFLLSILILTSGPFAFSPLNLLALEVRKSAKEMKKTLGNFCFIDSYPDLKE